MSYFDRQGRPITLDEWSRSYLPDVKRVAYTLVGAVEVSTVWLGLDHNWNPDGPPLIFETMVFGGELDAEQWRYPTEAGALAGHEATVLLVRGD